MKSKKRTKRVVGRPEPLPPETSTDTDVRPVDLLCDVPGFLRTMYLEVQKQWGDNMRVGTSYAYFSPDGRLHVHFASRAPLKKDGPLAQIVDGYLPSYFVNESANNYGSLAEKAAELMVSLSPDVDPNDEGWNAVIASLEALVNVKQ